MASHEHLTNEYFEQRSTLPGALRVDLLLDRLRSLHPSLGSMIESWRYRRSPPRYSPAGALPPEAELLTGVLLSDLDKSRVAEEASEARRDYIALLRLDDWPPRVDRVQHARSRFTSPALVALLLAEARYQIHDDPEEARWFAQLAEQVAGRGFAARVSDCAVLATAYHGNSLRAGGDLDGADAKLRRASRLAELAESTTPWVLAELSNLWGSLLKDRRKPVEAGLAYSRAAAGFEIAQDSLSAAKVALARASLYKQEGDLSQAVELTRRALPALAAAGSDRQILWAHHNLAVYYCEAGNPDAAQQILAVVSPLYERFPDRNIRIRRQWLRGLIALETGDSSADSLLKEVVESFLETGSTVIAAVAALDLARLYLSERRVADLVPLVAALAKIFRREGIHREAAACVLLLARSLSEKTISQQFIIELRQRLERSI